MVHPQDLLLASTFELVDDLTWMASLYDDRSEEQRAFLLFATPVNNRKYFVTYAEIDPEDCFGAPVFLEEIYHVDLWAAPDHLMPLLEQIKDAIVKSSLSSPSSLPHLFGGTYRHQVTMSVEAPRSTRYD